jgi:hypothetical protein
MCCALVVTAMAAPTEKTFSHRLSDADFKAAGLDKLTPAERARLDELIAADKPAVRAAETTVRPAAPETMRGKIAGDLSGWEEGSVLTFEDGSRWQVVSKGRYRAAPVRQSPKVELFPLASGDYVMTVDTVPRRAQVRRVVD